MSLPEELGQPWIYVDKQTGTQVPLSYRKWPGTFRPDEFGLTTWKFTKLFGRQMPGGGPGEIESENPEESARAFVSGKLEINCLACHNGNPGQDQAEYANQVSKENFRWAAAASCDFTRMSGSAKDMPENYDPIMPTAAANQPKIDYLAGTFDPKGKVFFDIRRKALAERCYFCHSNAQIKDEASEKWETDEDVHLSSGLTCIDCHRNDVSHEIIRGYEGEKAFSKNPVASDFSCQACHTKDCNQAALNGRLGAPIAEHKGLPEIHFAKLTCTACHSGPMPGKETENVKTSMAHGLGVYSSDKSPDALPHIDSVVFAKGQDGKIAPSNLIWPSYWASYKDEKVVPLTPDAVRPVVEQVITEKQSSRGDWLSFNDEQVTKILSLLVSENIADGKAVYLCGGKMYSLANDGKLVSSENAAASAYLWPIAHDVRPTSQSLGINGCDDCHAKGKPFFFGKVAVDAPLASAAGFIEMNKFTGTDPAYTKAFADSFDIFMCVVVIALISSAVLAAVAAIYAFAAILRILKFVTRKD